jgi:hypothetical protein
MRYFLPNRKTMSAYYQAPNVHLPTGGDPMYESYTFNPLATADSQEATRTFESDAILWGLAGCAVVAATGIASAAGAFVQIYHIHQGKQRTLFNKPRPLDTVLGSGQKPFLLTSPLLIQAGDSVMVEVKSLDNANNLLVEVLLCCNSVPGGVQ